MQFWFVVLLSAIVAGCLAPAQPGSMLQPIPPAAVGPVRPPPASGRRIIANGAGGYTLPDGSTVAADAAGGFTLPNGTYVAPNSSGGITLPNGSRCEPDGAGGYLCP
jgi:hypothetical protein